MNLLKFKTIKELGNHTSDIIIRDILQKPDLLLCTASGNSTTETYIQLTQKKEQFSSAKLRILKLDEWCGIESCNPHTCETYLRNYIVAPLKINEENYISFQCDPTAPEIEANRILNYLNQHGPIDVCILGLGLNGHIAFNEPSDFLQPNCHVAELSEASKKHPMFLNMNRKPTYGLTLGMTDILQSKKVILIISGKNKQPIIEKFLTKKITTSLPASFLWLHKNVECLIVEE